MPATSPSERRPPSAAGAVADTVTVSPFSRNERFEPSAKARGSAPFQVSSIKEPRCDGSGPETVPEA